MIIEDEILIAIEVEHLLRSVGFTTFDVADNPAEALTSAQAHRPDLITADIQIVGGTGIEAVCAIIAALGAIPVIYVTGNPDMVGGRDATVVEKPIGDHQFFRACERVCGTH